MGDLTTFSYFSRFLETREWNNDSPPPTIEALSYVPAPKLALRLYLQCVETANDCDLEPIAYEFFTQAFVLYEEEIAIIAQSLNTHKK
ncbi:unnamed protein product [Lactuca saligna]|uniref:Uncharacterized protein n=1 Tax=Lactuca saligna TaxID=75948 RepID=A0AA35YJN4_LACSI|nr:unnamed protein product [Lactuca saligna]